MLTRKNYSFYHILIVITHIISKLVCVRIHLRNCIAMTNVSLETIYKNRLYIHIMAIYERTGGCGLAQFIIIITQRKKN